MNRTDNFRRQAARDAAETRFARGILACLSEKAADVSPDIGERLRFARENALERARAARPAEVVDAVAVTSSGTIVRGLGGSPWWLRFASVLPLVALVGGLVLIQEWQARTQISVAAEVDAALLGDDLPINAYRDPGFVEYLKAAPSP